MSYRHAGIVGIAIAVRLYRVADVHVLRAVRHDDGAVFSKIGRSDRFGAQHAYGTVVIVIVIVIGYYPVFDLGTALAYEGIVHGGPGEVVRLHTAGVSVPARPSALQFDQQLATSRIGVSRGRTGEEEVEGRAVAALGIMTQRNIVVIVTMSGGTEFVEGVGGEGGGGGGFGREGGGGVAVSVRRHDDVACGGWKLVERG